MTDRKKKTNQPAGAKASAEANVRSQLYESRDVLSSLQSAIGSLRAVTLYSFQPDTKERCQAIIEELQVIVNEAVKANSLANNGNGM